MTVPGRYDGDLQMFVEEPREPDLAQLRFLRWLAEHERLEHPVAGPPPGGRVQGALGWDPEDGPVSVPPPVPRPHPNVTNVPPWFGR